MTFPMTFPMAFPMAFHIAFKSILSVVLVLSFTAEDSSWAWDQHTKLSRLCFESYKNLKPAPFESIEKVLPVLRIGSASTPLHLAHELSQALVVHEEKIQWDWKSERAVEVLSYSAFEPDFGMDQNHNLGPDQKFMGGYTGSSSQGVRHMYYLAWDWKSPLALFHYPLHEMGFAKERALLYFNLALQAKKSGHWFWAYRFLGWGLHYIQDLSQPYHVSQFGSFKLLPLRVLFTKGWNAFIQETTRIVGNFHIAFEHYADFKIDQKENSFLKHVFTSPQPSPSLKLNHGISVEEGLMLLIKTSNQMASSLVRAQIASMGEVLFNPTYHLSLNEDQAKTLDYAAFDCVGFALDPVAFASRKSSGCTSSGDKSLPLGFQKQMLEALSNMVIASRWYLDQFLSFY